MERELKDARHVENVLREDIRAGRTTCSAKYTFLVQRGHFGVPLPHCLEEKKADSEALIR